MLFREFGEVDAFPLCLDTKDPEEIVQIVKLLAPGFGDIKLDTPVFHDDQHGTAVVVLAALINSQKIIGKRMQGLKVVINGLGASGIVCARSCSPPGWRTSRGATAGHRPQWSSGHEPLQSVVRRAHELRRAHRRPRRGGVRGADLFLGSPCPRSSRSTF